MRARPATAREQPSARSGPNQALGVHNDGMPSLVSIGLVCERLGTRRIGLWEEPPRQVPIEGQGSGRGQSGCSSKGEAKRTCPCGAGLGLAAGSAPGTLRAVAEAI